MSASIVTLLDEEYVRTLQAVSSAQAGSEEAKWQLQKLSELHKQRMNEQKADSDAYAEMEELALKKAETAMKEKQSEEGKKAGDIKLLFDVANVILNIATIAIPCIWMRKGLKFEETGTYTSRTLQWVNNHLRMFKK